MTNVQTLCGRGVLILMCTAGVSFPSQAAAQDATTPAAVPTLIPVEGTLTTPAGEPRRGSVVLVLSLYADNETQTPLWREYQIVDLDAQGRYTTDAGKLQDAGIPADVFSGGAARWLGVGVDGETEQARVRLIAIPYAASAGDARTLAGRTIDDFVLVSGASSSGKDSAATSSDADGPVTQTHAISANFIPKFEDNAGNPTNSVLFELNGKIGLGTTNPLGRFDVTGPQTDINLTWSDSAEYGRFLFREGSRVTGVVQMLGSTFATAARRSDLEMNSDAGDVTLQGGGGRVGIGTRTPFGTLDISASQTDTNLIWTNASEYGRFLFREGTAVRGIVQMLGSSFATTARRSDLEINSDLGDVNLQTGGGNVGIGTNAPATKLHIVGNVTVDGNIGAKYQDVAEWVDATEPIEPGTVVVVDPKRSNAVKRSSRGYDSGVAGAVSPQPGLILGEAGPNKVLVAQSGRVKIKVDARYGAIKPGDLLVTSPRAGYAMRSKPMRVGEATMHRPGTVLGKALEALPKGTGEILVLLTLQ